MISPVASRRRRGRFGDFDAHGGQLPPRTVALEDRLPLVGQLDDATQLRLSARAVPELEFRLRKGATGAHFLEPILRRLETANGGLEFGATQAGIAACQGKTALHQVLIRVRTNVHRVARPSGQAFGHLLVSGK